MRNRVTGISSTKTSLPVTVYRAVSRTAQFEGVQSTFLEARAEFCHSNVTSLCHQQGACCRRVSCRRATERTLRVNCRDGARLWGSQGKCRSLECQWVSRCRLWYRVRVRLPQGAGLLNRESWPHEAQMPNQLPGLLVKSAGESDGHLWPSDLIIVLHDALIVN